MLYYLFRYLEETSKLSGAGLFEYVSFRAAMTLITSLFLSMIVGKYIIKYLQKKQIGESIRNLGLEGQMSKKGTPTMGGIIILISIIVPCLLFGRLRNIYLILMLVSTIWLGAIGFIDDYIKVFKKNKEGLSGRFKIIGQIGLGLIIGLTLMFSPDSLQSTKTTIPFFNNFDFDYGYFTQFMGEYAQLGAWILFIGIVVLVIAATSNGANLTDGLDGLAAGTSGIIGLALIALAYVSSNVFFADYLNVMYIPESEELVVYGAAYTGALVGFLWYNTYPAQVFMGDTGSLSLGGIIGVFAILIHKELLLPILCGIFLIENLSVMIQVSYFKYTKKKYGEGKRVFLMAPLHHHFQKKGIPEAKIVTRFWIVAISLAIFTIITLKIR